MARVEKSNLLSVSQRWNAWANGIYKDDEFFPPDSEFEHDDPDRFVPKRGRIKARVVSNLLSGMKDFVRKFVCCKEEAA